MSMMLTLMTMKNPMFPSGIAFYALGIILMSLAVLLAASSKVFGEVPPQVQSTILLIASFGFVLTSIGLFWMS